MVRLGEVFVLTGPSLGSGLLTVPCFDESRSRQQHGKG